MTDERDKSLHWSLENRTAPRMTQTFGCSKIKKLKRRRHSLESFTYLTISSAVSTLQMSCRLNLRLDSLCAVRTETNSSMWMTTNGTWSACSLCVKRKAFSGCFGIMEDRQDLTQVSGHRYLFASLSANLNHYLFSIRSLEHKTQTQQCSPRL